MDWAQTITIAGT